MENTIFIVVVAILGFFGFLLAVAPQPGLLKFVKLTVNLLKGHLKMVLCFWAFLALISFLAQLV